MLRIEQMDQILELETEEAIEAVEKALLESEHEELYILQGMIYQEDYKTELALESYDKAIEFNKENHLCYLAKAKFYMDEHKSDKAMDFFLLAVDKKACRESFYYLGNYYAHENEEEKAIENFTKAVESQDDVMFFGNKIIYDERGMCNYYASNYENAINDFWKAYEISEKSFNPYLPVSNAYRGWKKYNEVIEISNQFKKLKAEDVSFNIIDGIDEIYDNTIHAYEKLEEYVSLIKECDEFIEWSKENDYNFVDTTLTKARIYYEKLKDEKKSNEVISKLLSLNFKNFDGIEEYDVINDISNFYKDTEQYEKQIDFISSVNRKIFVDKGFFEYLVIMKLADAYYKLEKYNEAKKICEEAKELDPENSDSYEMLAEIYHSQGKKDAALKEFDIAYEMNEENMYIVERKMRLCTDWEYLDEALEACELLIEKEHDVSDMYFDKGIILTAMSKLKEALDAYYISLDLNKESVRPYVNMHYLHKNLGMDDEAISDSTIIIESDDDSLKYIGYYQRSNRNYDRGNVKQAIEDMTEALTLKPDLVSAAIDLAEMLMIGGYYEKGLNVLIEKKELYDDFRTETIYYFLEFLGHILLEQMDKAEEAKKNYIQAGKKHKGDFAFGITNLKNNIKTDKETLKQIMEVGSVYFD